MAPNYLDLAEASRSELLQEGPAFLGPRDLGSASNVCVYRLANGSRSWTEYQTADGGLLIDVAVEPRTTSDTDAFNEVRV